MDVKLTGVQQSLLVRVFQNMDLQPSPRQFVFLPAAMFVKYVFYKAVKYIRPFTFNTYHYFPTCSPSTSPSVLPFVKRLPVQIVTYLHLHSQPRSWRQNFLRNFGGSIFQTTLRHISKHNIFVLSIAINLPLTAFHL